MKSVITVATWGKGAPQSLNTGIDEIDVKLYREPADDESVRRLRIESGDSTLVLMPSKGLNILSCSFGGRDLFWEPPLDRIPASERLDLTASILINGEPVEGARWLEGFTGGVEMMGLDHWGIFGRSPEGELLTLHGNISYVPVSSVEIGKDAEGRVVCEGSLKIYGPVETVRPQIDTPARWEVVRRVILNPTKRTLTLQDRIINLSDSPAFPDWAYHVQLKPEAGCRFLIPSGAAAPRFGGDCEADFETWTPAAEESVREERGYVHKKLLTENGAVPTLLRYPDGTGIEARIPHAPFTLGWFSCGGRQGTEFLLPENPETPFIPRSWNGVGPEVGASALDHDGNTDPEIGERKLNPGESRRLELSVRLLETDEAAALEETIVARQAERTR